MKPLNFCLLRSSLVAALGGLLFGFDTAVFAATTRALTQTYGLSAAMLPAMAARSGAIPLVFSAVMMAVQFVVVLKLYPETKGISLENTERHLIKQALSRNSWKWWIDRHFKLVRCLPKTSSHASFNGPDTACTGRKSTRSSTS